MQILKGNNLKSVTVQNILANTNSICYVYYNHVLPFDYYSVNSDCYTIEELQGYLREFINNIKNDKSKFHDYFIVYTNNTERELSDLIEWLKNEENDSNFRCIMITCKL